MSACCPPNCANGVVTRTAGDVQWCGFRCPVCSPRGHRGERPVRPDTTAPRASIPERKGRVMDTTWMRRLVGALGPVAAGVIALTVGLAKPHRAHADGDAEATEKRERCATRLSIAFLGKTPSSELLAVANPQESVDKMLADTAFIERF